MIDCHCVLPQYRKLAEPVFHKFVVFSVIDDSGTVVPKISQCDNCGSVHKVYDICKSEIIPGKDETRSVITKKDVSHSLPQNLVSLLEEYNVGIADYEMAKFIIDNERWGSVIILSRETEEDGVSGKMLNFVASNKFRVDPYFGAGFVK